MKKSTITELPTYCEVSYDEDYEIKQPIIRNHKSTNSSTQDQYLLLDLPSQISHKPIKFKLSWLNKWILILPMIALNRPTIIFQRLCLCCIPHYTKPIKPLNRFMVTLWVITILGCMVYVRIKRGISGFKDLKLPLDIDLNLIFDVVWLLANIFDTISRIYSIWYFYFHFNWPWIECDNKISVKCQRTLDRYCSILRILFVILIALYATFILDDVFDTEKQWYLILLNFITSFWPRCVNITVACAIFLKYHIYLSSLNDHEQLRDKSITIHHYAEIFDKYEGIWKGYKMDYHWTLNLSLQILLLDLILFQYRNAYHILQERKLTNFVGLFIANIFVYIVYGLYGLLLTESFNKFRETLFESGRWYITDKSDNIHLSNRLNFHYLMDYVEKNNMEITLGKITVTRGNIIKFILGLLITQGFGFMIKKFLDSL